MTARDRKVVAALPWERISVVAVDLDGTLLRRDDTVSERTMSVLQRLVERGVRLVVATGRRVESVANVVPEALAVSGYVCNNGGDVRLDGDSIHCRTLDSGQSRAIADYLTRRWPEGTFVMVVEDKLYANREMSPEWQAEVADVCEMAERPVSKFLLHLSALTGSESIASDLPQGSRIIVMDYGRWGEIVPEGISKAVGLELLLRRWGLTLADAVCFGDDTNDAEMIAECGIGVAMGNAAPEVKAVADVVAPPVEEDGVAQVLESFLEPTLASR